MKLYHGTSGRAVLRRILKQGISPRGKKKGNWDHTIDSNPNAVYLTTAYPVHFAINSAKNRRDLVVVEIDSDMLDQDLLAPDEDFLEQATRGTDQFQEAGATMEERTRWFRARALFRFGENWKHSVKYLGTCAYYDTIPVDAITRVAIIPDGHEILFGSDPVISTVNYRIMGPFYRGYVQHIFGDEVTEEMPFPDYDPTRYPRDGIKVQVFK